MKKQITILISLAFFIVSLNAVSAMISSCGDGYCDDAYYENDIDSSYYCPIDCGLPERDWCDETYPTRNCPTCPTGSTITCRAGDVPTFDLKNWCNNNYVDTSICPFPWVENIAFFEITGSKCKDGLIFFGIGIFLVAGILGFLIKKRRHKRK
jgi:hypothetical protein